MEIRNGNCGFCGEEVPVDDLREFDLGTDIKNVCSACYEELKSEYGLIDFPDREVKL